MNATEVKARKYYVTDSVQLEVVRVTGFEVMEYGLEGSETWCKVTTDNGSKMLCHPSRLLRRAEWTDFANLELINNG